MVLFLSLGEITPQSSSHFPVFILFSILEWNFQEISVLHIMQDGNPDFQEFIIMKFRLFQGLLCIY